MKTFLALLAIFRALSILSQSNDAFIEARLEAFVSANPDIIIDRSDLLENLEAFASDPINLNKTDREELGSLQLLTEIQINNLLEHIRNYGELTAIEELQMIPAFDSESIELILPFISVRPSAGLESRDQISKKHKTEISFRYQEILERSKGYTEVNSNKFVGSPYALYTRIQHNYGSKMEFGLTAEKDAGEAFLNETQKHGFDFYSAYAQVKGIGKIECLIIGDFKAQFGQGLTFFSAGGAGKSSEVLFVEKSTSSIRPYRSVNETQYLRGIATTLKFGKFKISPFLSKVILDANLDENTSEITSYYTSGTHRNTSELSKKSIVSSVTEGFEIKYSTNRFVLGLVSAWNHLDRNLNSEKDPYEFFRQNDNYQTNTGIHYSYVYKNINFFGEFAHSWQAGNAFISGVSFMPDKNVGMVVSYRNYDRDYIPIQSAGFGEQTLDQNEEGLYGGCKVNLTPKITWSTYADIFQFKWLKYGVSAPSHGVDYLSDLRYSISKSLEIYCRWRFKEKENDVLIDNEKIPHTHPSSRQTARFQVQYQVNDNLRWRSRFEMSWFDELGSESSGNLTFQELKWQKMGSAITLLGRYTIFDTEDYDTRIYTFEQDVPGSYSIPSYSGKGSRYFILVRYRLNRKMDFWIRYGQVIYQDQTSIGSGLNEIIGDRKSEVKMQFRIKL